MVRGMIKMLTCMRSFSSVLLDHIQLFSLEKEFTRFPILDLDIYVYELFQS